MRDFLRFFLSAADQARVEAASIGVADVPLPYVRDALLYGYQSLQITFRITDPGNGAPQLRPLFPGSVQFLEEPGTPGALPDPAAINLTAADVATWRTYGTLKVKLLEKVDKKVIEGVAEHTPGLEVEPNVAWYSPVRLSEAFLLTTLVSSLAKVKIGSGGTTVKPANAEWPKHAVSRFLQGSYTAALRLGASAADDDVAKFAMPTLEMDAAGNVTLFVTIARAQPPQDGANADFDALAPGVTAADPEYPGNGLVPARHVYRSAAAHLIDGATGTAVVDAVLASWPAAQRYFPLSVTRTWRQIPNFSIHFPSRNIHVSIDGGTTPQLPIPAHGIVFVPQATGNPEPGLPLMHVVAVSGPPSTFLDGRTADAWKVKATSTMFLVNFTDPAPIAHVILRRQLKDEILADKVFPKPGGMRCTYMSLRRATRAFVDHRLTGGRLVNELARTTAATKKLMTDAWGAATAEIITDARPAPAASPGKARTLEAIWEAFFPDTVPAQNIGGSTARTVAFNGGKMFYALWQTIEAVLGAEGTKRNFPDAHVGKGAPGAIVAIGLSAGYLVDPAHANAADIVTNVTEMLDGRLTPGCMIQFWNLQSDYTLERTRQNIPADPTHYGHSPIHREYMPPAPPATPAGIMVVDQFGGETKCPTAPDGRISWRGGADAEDVWIAAQWDD